MSHLSQFAPYINSGFVVNVSPGSVYFNGTAVTISGVTSITCAANTTTYIFVDGGTRAITSNTTGFPVSSFPIAIATTGNDRVNTLLDNRPDLIGNGKEFLGSASMSLNSTITFPARDVIECDLIINGYGGGGDIAALQFNADTGNNYVSRAVKMATGGTTWANTIDANTTNMIRCASTSTTLNRTIKFLFNNTAAKNKEISFISGTLPATVGTGIDIDLVFGAWFNNTAQVTSITLTTVGGGTVSGVIYVYGKNNS